jgi:pilus assembly protein CpaB
MKNKNALVALIIGVVFGLLSFFLLYQKLSSLASQSTPVEILVGKTYIPSRTVLRPDQVEKQSIPEKYVSPSAIRDIKEVDGLITLVPISAGEQILSNKFGLADNSLDLTLPQGYRAYTLGVNDTTGVGNLLSPGDKVDIISHVNSDKKQITAIVYQNVLVLATGAQTTPANNPPISTSSPSNSSSNNTENSYSTVTLAVTPDQAEVLTFLEENHPLRLVLRAMGDDEIESIPPQSDSDLINKIGVFSKPDSKKIEVIRGAQNSSSGD